MGPPWREAAAFLAWQTGPRDGRDAADRRRPRLQGPGFFPRSLARDQTSEAAGLAETELPL